MISTLWMSTAPAILTDRGLPKRHRATAPPRRVPALFTDLPICILPYMSELRLEVHGTGADGVAADELRDCLLLERDLHGRISMPWTLPDNGNMGAVTDVLMVALGSGGAVTALIGSLTAWLKHRASDVRITITNAAGDSVEISADRVHDIPAMIEQVLRARTD